MKSARRYPANVNGSGSGRIAYIDGLRAIAVLSVVAYHTARYSALDPHSPAGLLLHQGAHGVDLFFVLSGFCLAYPILTKLRETGSATFDVACYGARRLTRILPPYYAAIAIFVAFALILCRLRIGLPSSMPQHGFDILDVFAQALFMDGDGNFMNGSFWSLSIEFRWYFLFPLVLYVWTKSPRAFALIAIAAVVLTMTRAVTLDLLCLPAFLLGIVAADIHAARRHVPRWFVLLAFALPIAAFATSRYNGWNNYPNMLWQATAFALVVIAGNAAKLASLLSSRYLTAFGAASYSIYLIHEPIISFMEAHGVQPLMASAGGLAVGILLYWLAERPIVEPTEARARLLAQFGFLASWLASAGIPRFFEFEEQRNNRALHVCRTAELAQ